jgi:hypothetical protein
MSIIAPICVFVKFSPHGKGQKEKAKNVLEYLEDDIWKDFESKYNDFLKEML